MLDPIVEIFLLLLGLCIGSFLNVVIYRVSAGLSVAQPVWSFCPRCEKTIAWYDNLPVVSWLMLGAKCRHCTQPISVQYPLIEAATGLLFVLVYHLLFVLDARAELAATLPTDAPLLLAWLALVAGMLVCTVMDFVAYEIDIRVTNAVLIVGVLAHAAWPQPIFLEPAAAGAFAPAALAAGLVSLAVAWWTMRRGATDDEFDEEQQVAEQAVQPASPGLRLAGLVGTFALLIVAAWLIYAGAATALPEQQSLPVAVAVLLIFGLLVLVGGQQRAADDEIHEAIEDEAPLARRTIGRELLQLLPAAVVGAGVLALLLANPAALAGWRSLVRWSPIGEFMPLAGLVFAVYGAVVAAAAGWFLRILFTLIYGREAFGVGDIYILAAAGAAGGWDIALLGLLLSVGIALLGWLAGLVLKHTVMIPFGPWLALGFVVALWWNRPAQDYFARYAETIVTAWKQRPDMLLVAGGVMLVGTAAAIGLSRLVRALVPAPADDESPE